MIYRTVSNCYNLYLLDFDVMKKLYISPFPAFTVKTDNFTKHRLHFFIAA